MKKNLSLLVCFLCLHFNIKAQTLPVPLNSNFSGAYLDTCLYDATQNVYVIPQWEVYQTTNDLWDGQRDTTHCIDAYTLGSGTTMTIPLLDIDPTKGLFVKSSISNGNAYPLLKNNIYRESLDYYGANFIDTASICPEFVCTGAFIGVNIPDSTGLDTVIRWHKGIITNNGQGPEFCFLTEKFDYNALQHIYFRFQVQTPINPNGSIIIYNTDIMSMGMFPINLITHIDAPFNQYYFGNFDNSIIQYHDTTYPSPNHISYIDVTPVPQSTQVQMINLYPQSGVFFQPFTAVRGDTVVGGNGIRHNLHWWLNNTSCFPFIEVISEDKDIVTFQKQAKIEFGAHQSCMFFKKGSQMHFTDEVKFDYGQGAMGMLAWEEGMELKMDRGTELILHNQLMLKSLQANTNVRIILPSGSKLRFSPTAGIHPTPGSPNQNVKLEVYMKGGILDDSQLSQEYKDKIIRIYDKPMEDWAENVTIYPNPSNQEVYLKVTLAQNSFIELELNDSEGHILRTWTENLQKGENTVPLPAQTLARGIYFIKAKLGNETCVKPYMLLD